MISVMNVELGVCEILACKRKNRASSMDELSTQDIGIRSTTTLIDSRVSLLASRSHGQGIVVKEDPLMKLITNMVMSGKEIIESLGNVMKIRKGYFALIAAHANKRIVDCRGSEGFSFPVKGMARRTLNVHLPKAMNLPSRIKRKTCIREL
jgi:hypothetical protein